MTAASSPLRASARPLPETILRSLGVSSLNLPGGDAVCRPASWEGLR